MTKEQLADEFISCFPQHTVDYESHLADYGKLLEHVFFADMIDEPLFSLLKVNTDTQLIRKYIEFVERMYSDGDDATQNVVEVTILEYLGDDETVLRNAFSYFSEELMQLSKRVEASWGRRDIRIYYQRGKVLYDWKPVRNQPF